VNKEHPRPILGFLWPRPDPNAPVDEAYVQVRLIRVPSRGPLRIALLVAGTAGLTMLAGSALSAATGTSWLLLFPVSALLATFLVLLLRCWSVGTYVNDSGIAVQRLLGTDSARWAQIRDVMDESGLVIVTLRDGRPLRTHISRRSLDLIGRPEAYDMAKLALQRWGDQR
jgi:hypothetical protein